MSPHLTPMLTAHAAVTDWLGYTASALVLATFTVTSMRTLRCIAILSNIAFISYAAAAGLLPILVLHSVLLPTNIVRLLQIEWERRGRLQPPTPIPLVRAPSARRG